MTRRNLTAAAKVILVILAIGFIAVAALAVTFINLTFMLGVAIYRNIRRHRG